MDYLHAKWQEPSQKEDISVAISKLTIDIDDVSKQIKTVVRHKILVLDLFTSFNRLPVIMSIYLHKRQVLATSQAH